MAPGDNESSTNPTIGEFEREQTPPSIGSDGEGGERTARERLKKTSIAGLHQTSRTTGEVMTDDHSRTDTSGDVIAEQTTENGGLRGRPSKKRSFEDLQHDEHGPTENGSAGAPDSKRSTHKRMRSRDVQQGDDEYGQLEEMGSPVEEEAGDDAKLTPGGPGVLVDAPSKQELDDQMNKSTEENVSAQQATASEQKIGPGAEPGDSSRATAQESAQPTAQSRLPPSSGFANASENSPFGAVKSPPSSTLSPPSSQAELATTSNSAFASSGLSAFASSDRSPFGATNNKPSGGFGGISSGGFGGSSSSAKGFGSTSTGFSGASPFATNTSGFASAGGFGSKTGFGGTAVSQPFGGGFSTFAGTSGAPSAFSKGKPFGTKDDQDEEGSEDGEDDEKQEEPEEEQQDSRFHEQDIETGEEEEDTIFSSRAKLFHFESGAWKERGVGVFKINVRYEAKPIDASNDTKDEEADGESTENGDFSSMERRARMIMRTDGVHKVVLNSLIFKEMNVGTPEGEEPTGRTMHLTGLEDGRPRGFQIRLGKEEVLKDLYHRIQELKSEL